MRIIIYGKSLETSIFDMREIEVTINDIDVPSLLQEMTDKIQLQDILREYDFETVKDEYEKLKHLQDSN